MRKRWIFFIVGFFFLLGIADSASALRISKPYKATLYDVAIQDFLGMADLKIENAFSPSPDAINILAIGQPNKFILIELGSDFENIGGVLSKLNIKPKNSKGGKQVKFYSAKPSISNPITDPFLLLATGLAGIGIFSRKRRPIS